MIRTDGDLKKHKAAFEKKLAEKERKDIEKKIAQGEPVDRRKKETKKKEKDRMPKGRKTVIVFNSENTSAKENSELHAIEDSLIKEGVVKTSRKTCVCRHKKIEQNK